MKSTVPTKKSFAGDYLSWLIGRNINGENCVVAVFQRLKGLKNGKKHLIGWYNQCKAWEQQGFLSIVLIFTLLDRRLSSHIYVFGRTKMEKQAVVEVASELLFGLVQNGALVWPRSKLTLEIQLFWLKKFSIEWFSHKTFAREKIFFENVRHITNSL